jgi:hypothetical protein
MPSDMDAIIIRELLEGEEDLISAATEADTAFLRRLRCPKCLCWDIGKEVDQDRPFQEHSILAHWNARCLACGCLFSPHTSIIIQERASS